MRQFWPRSEMNRLGQSQAIFAKANTEVVCSYTTTEQNFLQRKQSFCSTDPNYSFKFCIFDFIDDFIGCHLNWFHEKENVDFKICKTREDITSYMEKMRWALTDLKILRLHG